MSESPPKKIKSIPRYQREDAAWGRSKTYELIKSGDLQTVRIAGRQYVVMGTSASLRPPPNRQKETGSATPYGPVFFHPECTTMAISKTKSSDFGFGGAMAGPRHR